MSKNTGKNMKAIVNTNIVLPDHMIENGTILIEDEKIVNFGRGLSTEGYEIVDGEGLFTGPGLIDIHIHAAYTYPLDTMTVEGADYLLRRGVTGILPTLYFTSSADELIESAAKIRAAMESGKAPTVLGIYMEGPYMNPKFGAHAKDSAWAKDICRENYMGILEAFGDIVKVWGTAPERENIELFAEDALKFNPSVVFSVAHSESDPYRIQAMKKYGLKIGTHCTNATGRLNHHGGCRAACVDEAVWYDKDIYAELICDKTGVHVQPFILRLVKEIKGDDRIILISDSCAKDFDSSRPPLGWEDATDINWYDEGDKIGISGTISLLPANCRNMMFHTGASLCQIFKYAATNPARAVGFTDRGEIAIGKRADLIMTDAIFGVKHVFLGGEQIN